MSQFKDLTGQRFGKLIVLHRVQNRRGQAVFFCQCDCGNTKEYTGGSLRAGYAKSCGCSHDGHPTHNRHKTTEYASWKKMMQRCYNPKYSHYRYYGGRGIEVELRWHKAINFLDDMGPKPSPKHTLERLDNSKGYSKENCLWETRKRQVRNRRNNVLLTYKGVTKCLAEWCEEYGQKFNTVYFRLYTSTTPWNIHDALTLPPDRNANYGHGSRSQSYWEAD